MLPIDAKNISDLRAGQFAGVNFSVELSIGAGQVGASSNTLEAKNAASSGPPEH
jgi:hypothetical protein